ncbi:MAG: hypothetical protein OHK0052_17920 [Anaerolineales bacterium]
MFFNPGDLILDGKYRVEKLLDDGGFADVYLVEDLHLRQKRALKILRQTGLSEAERREYHRRFKFESQLGARYDSNFIVKAHEFIDQDGLVGLEMAYAPGGSLAARLKQAGKLSIPDALRITSEIAQGLAVLHNDNIIHRDLKPHNVLFDANGHALVADLGLALDASAPSQHRSQLEIKHPGTLNYMSPEQYAGQSLTFASDIYALGCVLFEMLTGKVYKLQPPTRLKNVRPDAPAWLDTLLSQMLAESPAKRLYAIAEIQKILIAGSGNAFFTKKFVFALSLVVFIAILWFTLRVLPQPNGLAQASTTSTDTKIVLPSPAIVNASPTIKIGTNRPTEVLVTFTPTSTKRVNVPTNQILLATNTPQPTPTPDLGLQANDAMPMVYIEAGEFLMGSDQSPYPDEQPEHKVFVDDFWIDKTEVTNSMFAQFVNATNYVTDLEKQGIVWLYTNGSWQNEPGEGWRTRLE